MFNQDLSQDLSVDDDAPLKIISFGEQGTTETWVGRSSSWGEAIIGALPFLLYGLAYLLEGVAEYGGHDFPALTLMDGSYNRRAITLTAPKVVFFVSVLGLLFGVLKSFPRWSYAYLGTSLYFGWSYSIFRYGEDFNLWPLLPTFAAIILGLLFIRSLQPLARALQGVWNDWTRLSFALYAFALLLTASFFDDDWGVFQLYGLLFDTVLLAVGAVAFLRSRTIWGRVLSLQAVVLVLVIKGFLGGWFWQAFLFIIIMYFGLLLLPAVIGLLRWGVNAFASR